MADAESEKERIEGALSVFNKLPTFGRMKFSDFRIDYPLIDGIEIVRVNPHFDAAGEITSTDFWLYLRPAYFDTDVAHTLKAIGLQRDDSFEIDILGQDYKLHLELIFDFELDKMEFFEAWKTYKAENRERLDDLDRRNREGAIEAANTWAPEQENVELMGVRRT